MLRIILILLYMFDGFACQNVNERCLTPNNRSGICVNYNNCPFIYKILNQETITTEEINLLQDHLCEGDLIEVFCCPIFPEPGLECGFIMSENKIRPGKRALIDDHPWTAFLLYMKNGTIDYEKRCGGTLINNRYVITAAHCAEKEYLLLGGYTLVKARLGEYDVSTTLDCNLEGNICADPVLDVGIENVIVHEKYIAKAKNKANDIALLRLNQTITYTNFIKPLCLPKFDYNNKAIYKSRKLQIVGWGVTEHNEISSVKMYGILNGYPFRDCEATYKEFNIILISSHICAYDPKVDACPGDSGGPLIGYDQRSPTHLYRFLVGVVSFGSSYCDGRYPGIYTNVYSFMNWIQENTSL